MPWFDYKLVGGIHMPSIAGRMLREGQRSHSLQFLVDSGAAYSIVPKYVVSPMIKDISREPERDMGVWDANGKPMRGIPLEFEVELLNAGMMPTRERFWVCSSPRWTILGQTWFEKFAVRFHNFSFVSKGRRFAMHRPQAETVRRK